MIMRSSWLALLLFGCGASTEAPPAEAPAPVTTVSTAPPEDAPPPGKIGGEPILPDPVVVGGISREHVDQGVATLRPAIVACWEEARKSKPGLNGKILVKFTIAKDGSVKTTALRSTSLRNEATETCVMGHLAQAKFPPLASGELAIIHYPFAFPPGP